MRYVKIVNLNNENLQGINDCNISNVSLDYNNKIIKKTYNNLNNIEFSNESDLYSIIQNLGPLTNITTIEENNKGNRMLKIDFKWDKLEVMLDKDYKFVSWFWLSQIKESKYNINSLIKTLKELKTKKIFLDKRNYKWSIELK